MESFEPVDQAAETRAYRANRLAAIAMAFTTAAVLALLRPELFLVFTAYVAISVYGFSLVRTYGILVRPYPVTEQNFAAYVALSTIGFLVTLIGAPQVIALLGSVIYVLVAFMIALFVLHAIVKSL